VNVFLLFTQRQLLQSFGQYTLASAISHRFVTKFSLPTQAQDLSKSHINRSNCHVFAAAKFKQDISGWDVSGGKFTKDVPRLTSQPDISWLNLVATGTNNANFGYFEYNKYMQTS
jgi:hypothetical protein